MAIKLATQYDGEAITIGCINPINIYTNNCIYTVNTLCIENIIISLIYIKNCIIVFDIL